ncbi:MAG: sugar transferase (PEP-CTERM system associated) [Candidatus Paceibacteria bacterium]|jgi:sugar transferase (PEP-CTERM system associated)
MKEHPPMLRVLSHYLPVRKALLVLSETLILWAVLALAGSAHLWEPTQDLHRALAKARIPMGVETAQWYVYSSAFLLALLVQFAISFNELYDFRISLSRYDRARRFVGSLGSALFVSVAVVALADIWELQPALDFPGLSLLQKVRMLVFAVLVGFSLLFTWRNIFHALLHRARFYERVLILGSSKAAHTLAKEMREHVVSGYQVAGILSEARTPGVGPEPYDAQLTGTTDLVYEKLYLGEKGLTGNGLAPKYKSLRELVSRENINEIVVALSDRRGKLPVGDLLHCRLAGIPVRDYDAVFESVTGKISVEALRPSYLIFNEGFSRHPWADLLKGLCDRALALCMLLLLWPFMIATALAVSLTSPGPAFFSQERVGRNGILFTLYKFRSMNIDAESSTGPVWATENDPRITAVGRFIRKTRLDELPQLFNVLGGSMSLVGPRPERQVFVDELAETIPYFRQRQIVKPGLTGWAQINYPYGNTAEDAKQKLQYDLFYIKYQSFLFDLSILFNTIKTILLRKGT